MPDARSQAMPPDSTGIQRYQPSLGDWKWIAGSLAGAAMIVWVASQQVTAFRSTDDLLTKDNVALHLGIAQVDQLSQQRHSQQDRRLDMLEARAQNFETFMARMTERWDNWEKQLSRVEQKLDQRIFSVEVQPAPVAVLPPAPSRPASRRDLVAPAPWGQPPSMPAR